jgi:HPt (histidine-containing phosphotransfer) domain-containing protein
LGHLTVADAESVDPAERARDLMATIGARARTKNLQRVTDLEEGLRAATPGRWSDEARLQLVDVAHQLVGSAGTFGFASVSAAARDLEVALATGAFDDPDELAAAGASLEGMRHALLGDPDAASDD